MIMKNMKGNTHKALLFATLILLIASCAKKRINIYETAPDSILVDKIRKEVFVKLLVEDDLHPCGTGAQMMDEIKILGFWFNYYHEIDIDNARKIALKASNVALTKINNCEEIRPYLIHHPFKPQNIEITIIVNNPNGTDLPPEKLQIVTMKEGIIYYKNLIRDSHRFLTIVHQETYEEALAKLEQVLVANGQ